MNQQSTLVESTLRELYFRNKCKTLKPHQSTVLVLLFSHLNELVLERDLKELKDFHENNIRVRICPDEHILRHYDVYELARRTGIDDWISMTDAEMQKEKFDQIYIPILPFRTVSGLIHVNDTHPSIRIILWALMKGKKVTAFTAGADPYHPIWPDAGLNHGTAILKREMKKQLQQIRAFGIHFVEKEDELVKHFRDFHRSGRNQVITEDNIIRYVKEGKRHIEIDENVIITPLARDTAREYNIEIGEKKGR